MGIAALILGIISIIVGIIPACGVVAFVPAVIGLILGIVDIVMKNKKQEPKGLAIAGTVLSGIAVIFIIFWVFVIAVGASDPSVQNELNQLQNEIESQSYNNTDL